MTIALQILHHMTDPLLRIGHLLRLSGNLNLRAAGKNLEQGKLFLQQIELAVINAEKLYRVYGLEINDCFCQVIAFSCYLS